MSNTENTNQTAPGQKELAMLKFEILKNGSVICCAIARDLSEALSVVGLMADFPGGNVCCKGSDVFRARIAL